MVLASRNHSIVVTFCFCRTLGYLRHSRSEDNVSGNESISCGDECREEKFGMRSKNLSTISHFLFVTSNSIIFPKAYTALEHSRLKEISRGGIVSTGSTY
jgi:hypothetical protein